MCDYYESLFAVLLVNHRAHARRHYDSVLNITETERLSAEATSSTPVGQAEARNMVFESGLGESIVFSSKL
jgi:hypothetical protein